MLQYDVFVTGAVEGVVDEAVLRRLMSHLNAGTGPVYGREGKHYLLRNIAAYNRAAQFAPWLVLIDLDNDQHCAPQYIKQFPSGSKLMCLRVAVREIESWLMADRETLADYLQLPAARVPAAPEMLDKPKRSLVELASRSRSRAIRQDMVPRPGSGAKVGPLYNTRLVEFTTLYWRPEVAAREAASLRKCLQRATELIEKARVDLAT